MAKQANYKWEKRQKEIDRQQKKNAKKERKQSRPSGDEQPTENDSAARPDAADES